MNDAEKDVWSPHSAQETSSAMHETGYDADTDTEGASAMDDSEGSLEDAIASMSGKIDRTSAAPAPAHAEETAATDSSREVTFASPSYSTMPGASASTESGAGSMQKTDAASVSVGVVVGNISVSSLGSGLPINVREALRYRIRKKM